jgi:hypothetical protein
MGSALRGTQHLEALAATSAEHHSRALAEAQPASTGFGALPHTHGPVDEGLDWDHDP